MQLHVEAKPNCRPESLLQQGKKNGNESQTFRDDEDNSPTLLLSCIVQNAEHNNANNSCPRARWEFRLKASKLHRVAHTFYRHSYQRKHWEACTMGMAENRRGANVPNGLHTEIMSIPMVTPPRTRQSDIAVNIVFFAPKRSSERRHLPILSPFPTAVTALAAGLCCRKDLLMDRSRAVPQSGTDSSTNTLFQSAEVHFCPEACRRCSTLLHKICANRSLRSSCAVTCMAATATRISGPTSLFFCSPLCRGPDLQPDLCHWLLCA